MNEAIVLLKNIVQIVTLGVTVSINSFTVRMTVTCLQVVTSRFLSSVLEFDVTTS